MAVEPTFNADVETFKSVLKRYADGTNKPIAQTINNRMLDVAIKAYMYTKKADRARLEKQFGAIAQQIKLTKSKLTHWKGGKAFKPIKVRRGSMILGQSTSGDKSLLAASLIYNYRRKKRGLDPLHGFELHRATYKFVSAVMRSIGFLKSGYIPSMKLFNSQKKRLAGEPGFSKLPFERKEQAGKPKGYAYKATESQMRATIANSARGILDVGIPYASRALQDASKYMRQILARNLNEDMRKRLGGIVIRPRR